MEQEGTGKVNSPSEEIAYLGNRLRELESQAGEKPKQELIKEAILEHAKMEPQEVFSPTYVAAQEAAPVERAPRADEGVDIVVDEHGSDMQKFLQIVEDKGVWYALRVVKETSPHLLDDFHSVLVQYLEMKHNF